MTPEADDRPLAGIRVLDLSHMLAAPLATMMLADLGADVIKVEAPGGDHTRNVGTDGSMFLTANRNKRSIAIDLRAVEGIDLVLRIARTCDVVVEAFRPGVIDKLGLGLPVLREVNPQVILASLVGFGATGPDSGRRGVDLVVQAESGIMSVTGHEDGPPTKVGFQLVDASSGLTLAQAILAALLRRERFGRPSEVEVRLLDTALYLQTYLFTEMSRSRVVPGRTGNSAPHASPSDLVQTSDGALVIAAYFEDQWRGLCEVLDLPWMPEDSRFRTLDGRLANRDEMLEILGSRFRTQPRAYWYERLNARGVLVGEVRTSDEVVVWEQPRTNGAFYNCRLSDGSSVLLVASPYTISSHDVDVTPPPVLGADTVAVAHEYGLTDHEVAELIARGVLVAEFDGAPTSASVAP